MRAFLILVALSTALSALLAQSRPSSGPSDGLAEIRGRCVDAATKAPIAGVKTKLSGHPGNQSRMAQHGPVDWKPPAEQTTDADGRFTLRFVPPPPYQFSLDLSAEGMTPRTARWGEFTAGQVLDLGEIAFTKGYPVGGKVVDQSGAPVAKVSVALKRLPLPLQPEMHANDQRYAFTKQNGEFVFAVPIPPGSWPLAIESEPVKLVSPDVVQVREGRGAEPVTIVVKAMPTISGIVVDEKGKPVPDVSVHAHALRAGGGRVMSGYSRADGTFVIHATEDDPPPARLAVVDPGPCEPWSSNQVHAWGTEGVTIELRRALAVELTVVEKETGKPIEAFAVECLPIHGPSSSLGQPRLAGRHEGGHLTVDKVARGENVLIVHPADPAFERSERIVFTAHEGKVPAQRIELARQAEIAITVVRSDGTPVVGTRIELCEPRGAALDLTTHVPHESQIFTNDPRGYQGPRLLGQATSDANGIARLRAPRSAKDLVVRVLGPGHVPKVALVGDATTATNVKVAVEPGALVAGVVGPETLREYRLYVRVRPGAAGAVVPAPVRPLAILLADRDLRPVGSDGKFEVADLAPGEWTVVPVAVLQVKMELGGGGSTVEFTGSERRVKLEPGQRLEVALDAPRWVPATLDGIVTLDDQAPASSRVLLLGTDGTQTWTAGGFVPEPTGRFRATGLPPGHYRVQLVLGDFRARDGQRLDLDDEFEVTAGKSSAHEFRFKK